MALSFQSSCLSLPRDDMVFVFCFVVVCCSGVFVVVVYFLKTGSHVTQAGLVLAT